MTRYAENTQVSSEKSRGEIERTLMRYGAQEFSYGWSGKKAIIAFKAKNRFVRFTLPLPDKLSTDFTLTPGGRRRRDSAATELAWEQACRQRWRALALAIKAKLEAVACGITTFEEEFLAHILLPNGQTVAEATAGAIESAYKDGRMPKNLLLTA